VKWGRGASASAGGAQKGAGVRGRATWPGISACGRGCTRAGPRRGVRKAELIGRSHSAARERERERERAGARGNNSASGEAGLRGREGEERAGEGNRCRQPGPTRQRGRARGEGNHR
jgi:hypothetical protein